MVKNISRKSECRKLMVKFFGPKSGAYVDNLTESNCVRECRRKVSQFFGEKMAHEFDKLDNLQKVKS